MQKEGKIILCPFKAHPSFPTCSLSRLAGINLYISQHVYCKLSHYCDVEISSSAQSKEVLMFAFYRHRGRVSKHEVKEKRYLC